MTHFYTEVFNQNDGLNLEKEEYELVSKEIPTSILEKSTISEDNSAPVRVDLVDNTSEAALGDKPEQHIEVIPQSKWRRRWKSIIEVNRVYETNTY